MKGSKEKEAPKPAFEVGETVTLAEDFPVYANERATITAIRDYALVEGEIVADVELVDRKQEIGGGPVFLQNLPFNAIVKAE